MASQFPPPKVLFHVTKHALPRKNSLPYFSLKQIIQLPYFSEERRPHNQPTPLFLLLKAPWTCVHRACTRNTHLRTLRTMVGTTILSLSQCHLTSPRREGTESNFPKMAGRNNRYDCQLQIVGMASLGAEGEDPQCARPFSMPQSWAGHSTSKWGQSRTLRKISPLKHHSQCFCT